MKRNSILFLAFLFVAANVFSQSNSKKEFGPDAFAFYVKKYHPVSRQASLIADRAESQLRLSKGGFDPKLYTVIDEKNYSEKNYYSLIDAGLKVPTWFGLELKAGYQQNSGNFLNPENAVPFNGLFLAGADVSLLQGMFIDERRAMLKQAKIFASYSENEQLVLMNELMLQAFDAYWIWVKDYNQVQVHQKALSLAEARYKASVLNFQLGDDPAIDTLESYIQFQTRQYNLSEAEIQLLKSKLEMSTFLWFENDTPLELGDSVSAPILNTIASVQAIDSLNKIPLVLDQNHPLLLQYDLKLEQLDVERRLKAEKLKPTLNVNYNFLNEPINPIPFDGTDFSNYKWGLNFSFPIFIRKERGDLALSKIKIKEADLGKELKAFELRNKANATVNELTTLKQQLDLYRTVIQNYQLLLDAERQKFSNGESSVFLVNARELGLIQSELSYMAIGAKYRQAYIKRLWVQGVLGN